MEKIVAVPENELRWLTTLAHKYLAYEELLNNYTCEAEKSEAMDIYLGDSWECTLNDLVESDVKCARPVTVVQLPNKKYIGIVEL